MSGYWTVWESVRRGSEARIGDGAIGDCVIGCVIGDGRLVIGCAIVPRSPNQSPIPNRKISNQSPNRLSQNLQCPVLQSQNAAAAEKRRRPGFGKAPAQS